MTWTTRPRSRTGSLAFVSKGHGPRLVLIHGVGLRAEAWGAQVDALSDRFEILAPDMPGHGESKALSEPARLAEFSQAISVLLDRPTVVAGHSMGAMVALELAARHPKHVRGVVALNAIYRRSEAAGLAVKSRADSLDGVTNPDPGPTLRRWFKEVASPERQACETWLRTVDPAGYRSAYRVFSREDGPSDQTLQALNCPALFLTGGLEPNSTPEMSKAMAELVPKGRAGVLDTAAHMMPMTHADGVSEHLDRFARECLR
ncbi:MAG: alpha/beta hydrolase [Roseibium sp.]|uniref:alpha/beta fold hydrolase n=1 Tax=Roseibium sp. TaxID=1936156 RepID=UPI001B117DE6|nr:alpha/beta hydrolase [Roseibium sp.]MBO6893817.1 alpha/beta hydrolase [Roseibium sp.]MBO6931131.1 alpha/beta hydrolase [Roseibium sp.]